MTKYQHVVFNSAHLETLHELFLIVCKFDVELAEFNGEGDHLHLLVNYPPKICISKLVNSLKGIFSRKLKLHHLELIKPALHEKCSL